MSLTTEQQRFLWLHEGHNIVKWQWVLGGSMLRAYSDRGLTATISKAGVDGLVHMGAMEWGAGYSIRVGKKEKVA